MNELLLCFLYFLLLNSILEVFIFLHYVDLARFYLLVANSPFVLFRVSFDEEEF